MKTIVQTVCLAALLAAVVGPLSTAVQAQEGKGDPPEKQGGMGQMKGGMGQMT